MTRSFMIRMTGRDIEEEMEMENITIVCKDCGKVVYWNYDVSSGPEVGEESVSCGSPQCEDDTKYVVEYDSGQATIGRK